MSQVARIELLIQQDKYAQAEQEIRAQLLDDPNNGIYYSLLALCHAETGKTDEAINEARKAVGLIPHSAYAYYVLSKCYLNTDNYDEAGKAIREALRIDPEDEDYLCMYAAILNDQGEHQKGLITIDKALGINPEHASSKQVKSIILRGLGKYREADMVANEALNDNPESAYAFAAKGWSSLDTGQVKESLEHFKSAVMLDPNSDYAKSGLVMAIKAQNPLFNAFYKYYNWINGLSSGARWGFIIGIFILMRIARKISTTSSELAPVFSVIVGVYICFVFMVWTINPIFNIFMRFNKYGKHALDKGEIIGSNIMAFLLVSALIQFVLHLQFEWYPVTGAIGSMLLTLPFSSTFARWETKSFTKHLYYSLLLSAIWALTIALPLIGMESYNGILWMVFLVGTVGYTWVSQMGS
ncbi:tetratricopeptide repeat protein [Carboxylicivirga sp. RSCT41]|uniref:tetratricopeptide repeat protein n=1 Tax=Carboxylicivirga agarovorans TaxID=3417570 RepID=UPI003D33626A